MIMLNLIVYKDALHLAISLGYLNTVKLLFNHKDFVIEILTFFFMTFIK